MTKLEEVANALTEELIRHDVDILHFDGSHHVVIRDIGVDMREVARAALSLLSESDDTFLAQLSERMHDARFSVSGETYPVLRNFMRALVDAILNEEQKQ